MNRRVVRVLWVLGGGLVAGFALSVSIALYFVLGERTGPAPQIPGSGSEACERSRALFAAYLARARVTDSAEDWERVLSAAERCGDVNRFLEEDGITAMARGRRDLALAREADGKGDLDSAIRLAEIGGSYGVDIPGQSTYLQKLKQRKKSIQENVDRKRQFDLLWARGVEEESRGASGDPAVTLDIWKRCLALAGSPNERDQTQAKIASTLSEISRRDTEREYSSSMVAAEKMLRSGQLDAAERQFKEALKRKPSDPLASEGVRRVLTLQSQERFQTAMRQGEAAESRGEIDEAREAFSRAIGENRESAEARAALRRVERLALRMPKEFAGTFKLPAGQADQYGNAVVMRGGTWADAGTGWPYEIWLPLPGRSRAMEFVLVLPGEFDMGSKVSEPDCTPYECPVHRVHISAAFYLGKYEVTQAQWEGLEGSNPSLHTQAGTNAPVEQVSWEACKEFIRRLNLELGVRRTDYEFRLPSEAEWEYSCRAGTKTRFCNGDSSADLDRVGWFNENSKRMTHRVGMKLPNAWGLYDMHGNVYEWCEDVFRGYEGVPSDGSANTGRRGNRVLRGGTSAGIAGGCRSAARVMDAPYEWSDSCGFRIVFAARTR
jgi:formylglycine-generating enzyme required for sulfatase activity